MWTVFENNQVTLNLGATDIEYYDINGNETQLHSDDGRYTFLLNQKPFYIMGDFSDNVTVEENDKMSYSILKGKMVLGDTMNLTIDTGKENCTIDIDTPDGFVITENKSVNKTAARVKILAEKSYDEEMYIKLTVKGRWRKYYKLHRISNRIFRGALSCTNIVFIG